MIKVLLVIDDDLLRDPLSALLELEDDLTVLATTSDAAPSTIHAYEPAVAVIDLAPHSDGVAMATELIRAMPELAAVILDNLFRVGVLQRALRAGVRGFVLESTPAWRLADVIRSVNAGALHVGSDALA
ncbi:hypothetical protein [Streptomyces sp. SYSU K217416]